MADDYDDQDMDDACAVCGKHLNSNNRSTTQPDICKTCASEEESDLSDFR